MVGSGRTPLEFSLFLLIVVLTVVVLTVVVLTVVVLTVVVLTVVVLTVVVLTVVVLTVVVLTVEPWTTRTILAGLPQCPNIGANMVTKRHPVPQRRPNRSHVNFS